MYNTHTLPYISIHSGVRSIEQPEDSGVRSIERPEDSTVRIERLENRMARCGTHATENPSTCFVFGALTVDVLERDIVVSGCILMLQRHYSLISSQETSCMRSDDPLL